MQLDGRDGRDQEDNDHFGPLPAHLAGPVPDVSNQASN